MNKFNPMIWQIHQSNLHSSACCLYKAIFPIITPTIKNKTTSASSLVLRPSSFTTAAEAEMGWFVWGPFLIRNPSSSCSRENWKLKKTVVSSEAQHSWARWHLQTEAPAPGPISWFNETSFLPELLPEHRGFFKFSPDTTYTEWEL